jgi:hypothetical protein
MSPTSLRTRIISTIAALLLSINIGVALAHEGFEHVMGTVSKVTSTAITVQTTANKTVEVATSPKTTYTRGDAKIAATDLKPGDRVVIDATEVNNKLVAASVKAGTAAPTAHK